MVALNDLTNTMSYAIFDAYYDMNLPQPILSVKLHKNTPKKLYEEMGRFFFSPGVLTTLENIREVFYRTLDKAMDEMTQAANGASCALSELSNEETLKCYHFEFTVVFELQGNKLVVTNQVNNLSDKKMYFSVGAHEGYACPEGIEDYYMEFEEPQTLDSYILNGNLLEEKNIRLTENSTVLELKYDYFAIDAIKK